MEQGPGPQDKPSVLAQVKNTLNPGYHWSQLKQDLAAFVHAVKSLRHELHEHDTDRLHDLFRGRLMIAFYISGPFNMVAVVFTQALQYMLRLPESVVLLPIVANLLTGIVFQIVWAAVNRGVYRRAFPHLGKRIAAFESDMWPVHWAAIRLAAVFWFANLVVTLLVVETLRFVAPEAAHNIPWVVLVTMIEFIVVTPGFVRNIGDFFERHADDLAQRYAHVFEG